jgi:hypothetical protein
MTASTCGFIPIRQSNATLTLSLLAFDQQLERRVLQIWNASEMKGADKLA